MWTVVQNWNGKKTTWANGEEDENLRDMVQYLADSVIPKYIPSFSINWSDGKQMSLEDYQKANDIHKRTFEERMGLV